VLDAMASKIHKGDSRMKRKGTQLPIQPDN